MFLYSYLWMGILASQFQGGRTIVVEMFRSPRVVAGEGGDRVHIAPVLLLSVPVVRSSLQLE
eukprot:snap_masked-scaffold_21-processed-gene-2.33-mRNA-1 protein AED:1.00 eAED:1.00 QI:0/0/0/0/1/1/2/0/61